MKYLLQNYNKKMGNKQKNDYLFVEVITWISTN